MKLKNPSESCATCGKSLAKDVDKKLIPFCSNQCKLVDLGKWFQEEYTIPTNEAPLEIEGADYPDDDNQSDK